MGSVTFATNGSFPPIDVAPLPADNNQWPYHRAAEPSISPAGTLVFNPRDGLVTILAYTTGEEFYTDKDPVTGAWTFIDQSKPFVDTDDNDTFNGADICPTGTWAPANGVWDKDTTVWTETHILYTDRPKPDPQYSYIVPNPFPSVAKGTTQTLDFFFGDLNLNRSISAGTTFAATHTATKGSVTIPNPSILDGYGFSIEKMLVDAATEQNCVIGTTPICKWKWLFGTWGRGYSGSVVITGAPTSDVAPPSPDVVSVDSTVLGQKITTQATGTIQ
jgi:hypothetical protein